jgi:hypothetical protein
VAAEPAAAAAIARHCGYLPLALSVIATRLMDQPYVRLSEVAARLSGPNRLDELTLDVDGTDPVRRAFSESYLDQPPDTRWMFRCIGIATGAVLTVTELAAIADIDVAVAASHVIRLCSAHLLTYLDSHRIGWNSLLQAYAAERLRLEDAPSARAAASRRWGAYHRRHTSLA